MGDITSTCCAQSVHMQQTSLSRQFVLPPVQKAAILHYQPFQPIPLPIQSIILNNISSPYLKQITGQSIQQPNIWTNDKIITIIKRNKNDNSNSGLFRIHNNNQYQVYLKSLNQMNLVNQDDQVFSGQFLVYFPNKQYFLGTLNINTPTNGIFIFDHNCYYIGDICQLHAQGNGRYVNQQNGYSYEGLWSKSLQHGIGTQLYSNGDKFNGQFTYGNKFGKGTYTFISKVVYCGYFYNGLCDGTGLLTLSPKQFYKGQFKLGSIDGHGQYHYANGDHYEGQWLNGKKHGYGKYKFNQGWTYQGDWQDGKMHGNGMVKEQYDQIKGRWEAGKRVE